MSQISPVITPENVRPEPEGYSVFGWPKNLRDQYYKQWETEHPPTAALSASVDGEGESYANPPGYSDTAGGCQKSNSPLAVRWERLSLLVVACAGERLSCQSGGRCARTQSSEGR